ncbi:hypothetical protein DL98DRAFT_502360 [Cadophora sp. DSE1049]|nr:hypothetical protein DL98DRAFT_502360 [Cadophora sp. DSE1049]
MQQVKEAIPGTGPIENHDIQPLTKPPLSKANETDAFNSERGAFQPSSLSLPHRDLADSLLENYWTKSHTLYPFVHKPLFMRAYEDLWKPSSQLLRELQDGDFGLGTAGVSDSRTLIFHCALNAIFALSCQLSETAIPDRDRESISKEFFLRSKSLLHVDILDHGSVALVQTLLIIAQFLQSTSFPSRCWTSLGLACRIGQGLGLHVEDCNSRRDPQEVELRRRVWYGCTIMDIVASTTLGRPAMTPCQITIPLPSATAEDNMVDMNPPISQFAFYLETIKLYLILGKILSTVYKPWSFQGGNNCPDGSNKGSHVQYGDSEAIMPLDEELSYFEDEVTSYLHWERGITIRNSIAQPLQQIIQRQTNVLRARYLHIRVLLYRPAFLRFCRKVSSAQQPHQPTSSNGQIVGADYDLPRNRNLRLKMDMQSSTACVSAAVELSNLLFDATTKVTGGAWWYTTFYICTAGMVMMLAESCLSHQSIQVNMSEIQAAWGLCCETLRILIKRGHPVEPTLNGLCNIHRKLVPDQSPTGALTKPQDRLTMAPRTELPQARHTGVAQDRGVQSLFPEYEELNQGSNESEESFGMPTQPMMDFMMQDVNFMPFGVLDESWWRLQYGDTMANGVM